MKILATRKRVLSLFFALAAPFLAAQPAGFPQQQHQMFMQQMQMQRMMDHQWAAQRALAAKRAQQAALAARRTAPAAQPVLPKPAKEVWVGPAVAGPLQPILGDSALLAMRKKPRTLILLDRNTGQVRWETPIEQDLLLGPTALGLGDMVFYVKKDSTGVLLDAATGKGIRSVDLEAYEEFLMSGRKSHSRVLPPLVTEGRLVVAVYGKGRISAKAEGKVQAFDLASGAKAWEVEVPGGPDLMPVAHGAHVLVGGDGRIMAVEAATGKVAWTAQVGAGKGSSELDFGLLEGDRLFVRCKDNRIGIDARTGKELWRVADDGTSTLTAHGDRILFLETRGLLVATTWLVALDAGTGKTAWEAKVNAPQFPWAQDGWVLANRRGELFLLDLKEGKPRWSQSLPGPPASPLLPGESVVYLAQREQVQDWDRQASVLEAIDLSTGELRWRRDLDTPYEDGAILADAKGLIYLGKDGRPVRLE